MTDRTVLVRLKANVGDFVAGMGTARAAVRGVTSEIDTTNDRVAWLSQSILGIGPALVPLGAAAVPVFTGIATQATVAVAAVGVLALAFTGVGDAMKAVNDYQAKPTIENFQKMDEALKQLGPDGAHFVQFLDELTPQLRSLQMIAREGILPGAEDGLSSLMTMLPRLKGLVSDIAGALGQLMREAGQGISGDGLEGFFDYLDTDAKQILLDLGRTVGNFGSGFLNLLAGFAPVTRDFSAGLLDMSRAFNDWSQGLDQNQTFQDFISYVQSSTPKAMDFLASLADAFVAIVTAAAPVGDVMLPLLSELLGVIAAIASTPLGPIFITAAAAMSIYGRAVAIASVTTGGLVKSLWSANAATAAQVQSVRDLPEAYRQSKTAQLDLANAERKYNDARTTYNGQLQAQNRLRAQGYTMSATAEARLADSLGRVELAQRDVASATERAGAAERNRITALRGTASAAGKAGAAVAGLALISSDAGQKMSVVNTATFALMGAMLGGAPGAVAGGAVGATMDLVAASGKASESQRQLAQDIRAAGTNIEAYDVAISSARERYNEWRDDVTSDSLGEGIANIFDPDSIVAGYSSLFTGENVGDQMQADIEASQEWANSVGAAFNAVGREMGIVGEVQSSNARQIQEAFEAAQPAMAALGITIDDLAAAQDDGTLQPMIDDLVAWQTNADSAAGRTEAVVDAVGGLDTALTSTADSAGELATALDALLSPQMNLSEATDAWVKSIRTLDNDLAKNSKTLVGNSKQALQNREAIRSRVSSMQDVLNAEAEAGASSEDLSRKLRSQRKALLDAGKAAGMSKDELRDYLGQLGLTPKLVETLIKNNADQAKAKADSYYRSLVAMDGKSIQQYIDVYRRTHGGTLQGQKDNPNLAGGGLVTGPGGPTDDLIPANLSNREYVVRAAAVSKYGVGLMEKINRLRFAEGGYATYVRTRGADAPEGADRDDDGPRRNANSLAEALQRLNKKARRLEHAFDKSEEAVARETDQRDAVYAKMTEIQSNLVSGYRSDIFADPNEGATVNPWAAQKNKMTDANSVLDADIAQGRELGELVRTLEGKGLTGEALGELLSKNDIELVRSYANMPADALAAYSAKYAQRERVLSTVGAAAGQAAYGADYGAAVAEFQAANGELREIKQEQKETTKAIKQAQKAIEHADKNNKDGHNKNAGNAGRGDRAAARARRRARRT